MAGKNRKIEIDFLNYKIEALEKRVEILESARESLDKELLAILLHNVKMRDSHGEREQDSKEQKEQKKASQNDDKNKGKLIDDESDQKFDRLLQFSRRRIIV